MRCRLITVISIAGLSLMAAGCGGEGSPGAGVASVGSTTTSARATTGGSAPGGELVEYARCMRSHGVLGFPDPAAIAAPGGIRAAKGQMARISEADTSSATFQAAQRTCRQYYRPGTPPVHVSQQELRKLLAVSHCLRAHGIANFPDPDPTTGELTPPAGISRDSPQVLAALRACSSLGKAAGLGPPRTTP